MGQIGLEKRFQYYEELYYLNDIFGIEGKLVDVKNIKQPPFKFLFIDGDNICPVEMQKEYAHSVPSF